MPSDFKRIITYVDGLGYADNPDYKFIQTVLRQIIEKERVRGME